MNQLTVWRSDLSVVRWLSRLLACVGSVYRQAPEALASALQPFRLPQRDLEIRSIDKRVNSNILSLLFFFLEKVISENI